MENLDIVLSEMNASFRQIQKLQKQREKLLSVGLPEHYLEIPLKAIEGEIASQKNVIYENAREILEKLN